MIEGVIEAFNYAFQGLNYTILRGHIDRDRGDQRQSGERR